MKQYAFFLDTSTCSGCKACQVACQDKNGLPVGLLWRRVHEVTGGVWRPSASAWTTDVFAYYVSSACNHCRQPICVEVCPSTALTKRQDGIVLLDSDRCLGCRYCSWACPYDAPRYDTRHGYMTKCNMCVDLVDAGGTPACVAACPLRCMDFGELNDVEKRHGTIRRVYPLPDDRLTEPALVLKPHASAERATAETAIVVERQQRGVGALAELALIVFTICAQTAVGTTMFLAALLALSVEIGTVVWAPVVLLMFVALAASLFHLGTPKNAWRACANVRKSWLSREILLAGFFTVAIIAGKIMQIGNAPAAGTTIWTAACSVVGLALIVSMANVYRLRTIAAWNTARTLVSFLAATCMLGSLAAALLISSTKGLQPQEGDAIIKVSALIAFIALTIENGYRLLPVDRRGDRQETVAIFNRRGDRLRRAHMILASLAAVGLVLAILTPSAFVPPGAVAAVCLLLALAYVTTARLEHYAIIE